MIGCALMWPGCLHIISVWLVAGVSEHSVVFLGLFLWLRDNYLNFFNVMDTDSIFRNIDSEQEHLDSDRAIVTRTITRLFFLSPLY